MKELKSQEDWQIDSNAAQSEVDSVFALGPADGIGQVDYQSNAGDDEEITWRARPPTRRMNC